MLRISVLNAQQDTSISMPISKYYNPMVTDRPSQNETPILIKKGWFQVETGYQNEIESDKKNKVKTQCILYNTTLLKYGITDNMELRLITEYAGNVISPMNINDSNKIMKNSGARPINIGTKIAIQKEIGWIPEVSFLAHLTLPYFGSACYKTEYIIPRFRFLFNHSLTEKVSFSYNLGAEWEDGNSMATGLYTACLDLSISNKIAVFVESYGYAKEKYISDNRLDCGLIYQINRNFQLDCAGGMGLSEASPDYFICGGISVRFNTSNTATESKKHVY